MSKKFDMKEVIAMSVPIATEQTQVVFDIANKKIEQDVPPLMFSGMVTSLMFQNVTTMVTMLDHKPGSKEGEEMLTDIYAGALKDAIDRWNKPDIAALHKMEKMKKEEETQQ